MIYRDAKAVHGLRDFCKVGIGEYPEFIGSRGLFAVCSLVDGFFLVERAVVVYDGYCGDVVSQGGIEFGHVIPYPTVAGEADNGAIGFGAFGSNGSGKAPAEGSGTADEHLIGMFEVYHRAGPYPGVARVGDEDGV